MHGIDGLLLKRVIVGYPYAKKTALQDEIVERVRGAAEQEGRVFAIQHVTRFLDDLEPVTHATDIVTILMMGSLTTL